VTDTLSISDEERSWASRLRQQLHARQSMVDIVSPVFWRDVVVEFILCAFVECYVIWVLTTLRPDLYQLSTTHVAVFVSFLVTAVVEGYGPVSGAFVNPAGCWGFFLAGRISTVKSECPHNPTGVVWGMGTGARDP